METGFLVVWLAYTTSTAVFLLIHSKSVAAMRKTTDSGVYFYSVQNIIVIKNPKLRNKNKKANQFPLI